MEFDKNSVVSFYDELSYVLTDYETGEISDFELYSFLVDIHEALSHRLN